MKSLILSLSLLFAAVFSQAEINWQNCKAENSIDPIIYSSDFSWDYSLIELRKKSDEIYMSAKRLKNRAYVNAEGQIVLPYDISRGGNIVITQSFVEQISSHIEQGFQQNIIDAVFFPDMGHSHLFIPQKKYDNFYSKFEPNQFSQFYQKLFADTDLKILYHTAEQLKTRDENGHLIQDAATINRYQTRNLIGSNNNKTIFTIQNPESPANTAHDLPNHYYWGAGFNLSAQQNGCFSYRKNGQIHFFDLSMYDLESSDPGGNF